MTAKLAGTDKKLIFVKIENIVSNERLSSPPPSADLKDSIREHGVMVPIQVCKDDNDPNMFFVYAGRRRIKAVRELMKDGIAVPGDGKVPAFLDETLVPNGTLRLSVQENHLRSNNTVTDMQAIRKIVEDNGWTYDDAHLKEVAKILRVPVGTVKKTVKMLKVNEVSFRALLDGRITSSTFEEIAKIKDKRIGKEIAGKLSGDGKMSMDDVLKYKQIQHKEEMKRMVSGNKSVIGFDTTIFNPLQPMIDKLEEAIAKKDWSIVEDAIKDMKA
jgi:uncharacterized ParB-like nuclease family protein